MEIRHRGPNWLLKQSGKEFGGGGGGFAMRHVSNTCQEALRDRAGEIDK